MSPGRHAESAVVTPSVVPFVSCSSPGPPRQPAARKRLRTPPSGVPPPTGESRAHAQHHRCTIKSCRHEAAVNKRKRAPAAFIRKHGRRRAARGIVESTSAVKNSTMTAGHADFLVSTDAQTTEVLPTCRIVESIAAGSLQVGVPSAGNSRWATRVDRASLAHHTHANAGSAAGAGGDCGDRCC